MESCYAVFETQLKIRPDDIDMHRHVHNSKYLDYVLAARLDQMERCYGMAMEAFHERGLTWFVRAAHIEHLRSLQLSDSITVRTSIQKIERREVTVGFEIVRRRDGKLSAEGYFRYTLVDLASGRPQVIPEDIARAYSVGV